MFLRPICFSSFGTKTESTSSPVKKEEDNNVCRVIRHLLSDNAARLKFAVEEEGVVFARFFFF
jgi:hypothetical protein